MIEGMADKGHCIIEEVDNGLRIMPPAGWGAEVSRFAVTRQTGVLWAAFLSSREGDPIYHAALMV